MKRKFIFILSFLVIMIGGVYINNTNNKLRTIDLRKKLLNETFQIDGNNNDLNNSPGLSNPFVVGVDKEKFNNENLYNPENEVTHVVKGVGYGMDGENSSDDTLAFYNALEYIKTLDGEFTKLVLPSGNLDFIQGMHPENPAYGIIIKDIDNLLIEGDNTTIYFHGEFLGVLIENSKNIYLREVNFDWDITPFSMGTIIENDGQVFKVKVHDGYNVDENTIVKGFLEYDKNAYIPRVKGNDIYGDVKKVKYLGDNTLEISFNNKHQVAPENTLVVLRHFIYEYDLIFVTNSKNTYFENINVYTSLGMGVRAYTSENLYFNRFNTPLKPGTDRLMTTTADAIHTIDVKGDLKVTNSLFENNGDDALNTHGAYLKIYNLVNNKTFRASNPRGYNFMPNIGDKIEINDEFEMGVVQTLTVENAVEVSNGYEITVTEELSSDVLVGALVGNITRTAKLYFGNNIVRNKRSRGILIQTRDVVVENNLFANIQDAGILIISDSNDWYESINSENVLIKNNKFLKNNYGLGGSPGDITILSFGKNNNLNPAGTQKDITIENNFIANSANSGIGISSAEDVVVKNNWISNVALLPKINTYNSAFYITNSSDLSFINNLVEGNSNPNFLNAYVGPYVNLDNLLVENNEGLSHNDFLGDVVGVLQKVYKEKINYDENINSLSEFENKGTDLNVLGYSDVDQNEIVVTNDDFEVITLKLAYDDDAIYFGFEVADNDLIWLDNQPWLGDGFEIFISENTDSYDPLNVLKLDYESIQIYMNNYFQNVEEVRTSESIYNERNKFKFNFWLTDKGYAGKGLIPFEAIPNIKSLIDSGKEVSFNMVFSDADSNAIRKQIATTNHPVELNKFVPKYMGKISFVEEE